MDLIARLGKELCLREFRHGRGRLSVHGNRTSRKRDYIPPP
jgi:hypothetical protein